ncbi:hypothetical protein AB0G02_28485 [Actinosynnema sp. NPDC023658]
MLARVVLFDPLDAVTPDEVPGGVGELSPHASALLDADLAVAAAPGGRA